MRELDWLLSLGTSDGLMRGLFPSSGWAHPGLRDLHAALRRDWGLEILGIRGDMIGPVERNHIVVRLPVNRFGAAALRIVWEHARASPAVVADTTLGVNPSAMPAGWTANEPRPCADTTEVVDRIDEWCDAEDAAPSSGPLAAAPIAPPPPSPVDQTLQLDSLLRSVEALFEPRSRAEAKERTVLDVEEDEIARFLNAQTEALPQTLAL